MCCAAGVYGGKCGDYVQVLGLFHLIAGCLMDILLSPQGLQVKADYIPLLQSLATFGWRLTCVLPTPVIKTNR